MVSNLALRRKRRDSDYLSGRVRSINQRPNIHKHRTIKLFRNSRLRLPPMGNRGTPLANFLLTQVIPLFVTSLLVPMLCVLLRVLRTDDKHHTRLPAPAATKYIFAAMWTPVIMLLLGGFALAAALSKYDIAKRMATYILSKAGSKPRNVLLMNMFVAMVASMWISNVAAPVLCFSIILFLK